MVRSLIKNSRLPDIKRVGGVHDVSCGRGLPRLWGNVLDYPEAYGEVSATAGIAAAMITQGNPMHAKYVQKALDGVIANIASNGRVLNVSGGTAVMNDIDGYLGIDRKWAQGWGQGLALALLVAALEVKRE
jgi:unsaturated rhamnogalacturonyl hydrolase